MTPLPPRHKRIPKQFRQRPAACTKSLYMRRKHFLSFPSSGCSDRASQYPPARNGECVFALTLIIPNKQKGDVLAMHFSLLHIGNPLSKSSPGFGQDREIRLRVLGRKRSTQMTNNRLDTATPQSPFDAFQWALVGPARSAKVTRSNYKPERSEFLEHKKVFLKDNPKKWKASANLKLPPHSTHSHTNTHTHQASHSSQHHHH